MKFFKIPFLYLIMFIIFCIFFKICYRFDLNYTMLNYKLYVSKNITINIILLLMFTLILFLGFKFLKISQKSCKIYFVIMLILCNISVLCNDYYLGILHQNTSTITSLGIITLFILPFEQLFWILGKLNLLSLSVIIVNLYLLILYLLCKKNNAS